VVPDLRVILEKMSDPKTQIILHGIQSMNDALHFALAYNWQQLRQRKQGCRHHTEHLDIKSHLLFTAPSMSPVRHVLANEVWAEVSITFEAVSGVLSKACDFHSTFVIVAI
jgi:hypothetical protein